MYWGGLLALGFSSSLALNSSIGERFFWFMSSCLLQIEEVHMIERVSEDGRGKLNYKALGKRLIVTL